MSVGQTVIDLKRCKKIRKEDLPRFDYIQIGGDPAFSTKTSSDSFGIVICGTGIGISVSANKHKGIRAALCHDAFTASMARAHNNANILAFGQRVVGLGVIEGMIEAFLNTPYEGGRHEQRVKKIEEI